MYNIPKLALIIFFLLLLGLLFCMVVFLGSLFVKVIVDPYSQKIKITIVFTENEFHVSFTIIVVIGFFVGALFISGQRAWTAENFVKRIGNAEFANHFLFLIQQYKASRGWKDNVHIAIIDAKGNVGFMSDREERKEK